MQSLLYPAGVNVTFPIPAIPATKAPRAHKYVMNIIVFI